MKLNDLLYCTYRFTNVRVFVKKFDNLFDTYSFMVTDYTGLNEQRINEEVIEKVRCKFSDREVDYIKATDYRELFIYLK